MPPDEPKRPKLKLVDPAPNKVRALELAPDDMARVMAQRDQTTIAWRQLQATVNYCEIRTSKPIDGDEALVVTDPNLEDWRLHPDRQGVNAVLNLIEGVVELKFFGPDQTLAECFMAAAARLQLNTRFAIGRMSKAAPTSVLFKLRPDEFERLADEYAPFMPRPFSLEDTRRGHILSFANKARAPSTLLPGSLLWSDSGNGAHDLFVWRGGPLGTSAPLVEFFQIVRAAAYGSVLNLISAADWASSFTRRLVAEWLAKLVRDGAAINANAAFSKAARAIISTPQHAEELLALLCEQRLPDADRADALSACLDQFKFARKKLKDDPSRQDIAGWAVIGRTLTPEVEKALRAVLQVGADSTKLEDLAERYLFHLDSNSFLDCRAFREGAADFVYNSDALKLRHAPDLIMTLKKPLEAWPIFVRSALRRDVSTIDTYPDHKPGELLRVTREGSIVPDNDYAPDDSRLVFNDWRGLYVAPAKTVETALRAECEEKLGYMLSLVTNRKEERAAWIRRHIGWTLKHPGKKQQVALVCTGAQGTGKSFLCTRFAESVFGRYAGSASVRALSGSFYIPSYTGKLWVTHDEFVSDASNAEILKTLIRSTHIQGEFKGVNPQSYAIFARLAFTSNEINPGISRGSDDRGLFQVTSITAATEGLLPMAFQDRMRHEVAPFYQAYSDFLEREDVRQAYVRLLIDEAPDKMSDVEDIKELAMRDPEVMRERLTEAQMIAKHILEGGTIHGNFDIATPFTDRQLSQQIIKAGKDLGVKPPASHLILDEFINAGILGRELIRSAFVFKFKIAKLQELYSQYIGVPLYAQWPMEPLDYLDNDYQFPHEYEPWKGKRR